VPAAIKFMEVRVLSRTMICTFILGELKFQNSFGAILVFIERK
jgi:hypothetical protein